MNRAIAAHLLAPPNGVVHKRVQHTHGAAERRQVGVVAHKLHDLVLQVGHHVAQLFGNLGRHALANDDRLHNIGRARVNGLVQIQILSGAGRFVGHRFEALDCSHHDVELAALCVVLDQITGEEHPKHAEMPNHLHTLNSSYAMNERILRCSRLWHSSQVSVCVGVMANVDTKTNHRSPLFTRRPAPIAGSKTTLTELSDRRRKIAMETCDALDISDLGKVVTVIKHNVLHAFPQSIELDPTHILFLL
jgi:hypothetical protein